MKREKAYDMLCDVFGPPVTSGISAAVWIPSTRYVVKLALLSPEVYRLHRELMKYCDEAPIARILDMRVLGVQRFGYREHADQLLCIIVQERKFMYDDGYWRGGGFFRKPARLINANNHTWYQCDGHDGNHAEGVWIDLGGVVPMTRRMAGAVKELFAVVPVGA